VLFLSHTLDFRAGGAEHVLCDVLERIDRDRFEPELAIARDTTALPEAFRVLDLKLHALPLFPHFRGRGPRQAVTLLTTLVRLNLAVSALLKRERFDVIHVNSVFALHFCVWPARRRRVPLVYHEHGLPHDRKGAVWSWFYRGLVRRVACVICITDAVERQVMDYGVPASRVCTIYNGIAEAPDAEAQEHWRAEEAQAGRAPFTVVQIANFHAWKGHETVVRALAALRESLPEAKAVFFGEPSDPAFQSQLEARISELGVAEQVEFGGFRSNVQALIPAFDCLVLASQAEPFGLVLLEAMRAGVPVVASKAGGVPEIVQHEENGLLFEPDDARGLAEQLLRLAREPELRARLVERGRATLRGRFSLEAQARAIEGVLAVRSSTSR
jgi:glycosyltransferase involved in cell wall biosynthesis